MRTRTESRFFKNASSSIISQTVTLIASLIMVLLIPKYVGKELYGEWQLFVFYAGYAGFFQLGINDGLYLIHSGENYETVDKKRLKGLYIFLTGIVLITSFPLFLLLDESYFFKIMLFVYVLLFNQASFIGYMYQATNNMKFFSQSIVLDKAIFICTICAIAFYGIIRLDLLIFTFVACKLLGFFFLTRCARDLFKSTIYIDRDYVSATIKAGVILMLSNLSCLLTIGITRYFIKKYFGLVAFGEVSLSLSIISFVLVFVQQIGLVLLPAIKTLSIESSTRIYKKMTKVLYMIAPIIFIGYYPMSRIVNLWLPNYNESLDYIFVLLPVCIYDLKTQLLGNTYIKYFRLETKLLRVNMIIVLLTAIVTYYMCQYTHSIKYALYACSFFVALRSIILLIISEKHLKIERIMKHVVEFISIALVYVIYEFIINYK